MSAERIIHGPACIAEGLDWLTARDAALARAASVAGAVPLRRNPGGFAELFFIILGQQVSVASARAVRARLEAAGLADAPAIRAATGDVLGQAGLTRPKQRAARALAEADLDFDALGRLPSEDVIARLVQITGIGRWTAEIYVMFSLGRADVIAAGDLAIREAVRRIDGQAVRPSEAEVRARAEGWAPWRSVAARLLWAYYEQDSKRGGIA